MATIWKVEGLKVTVLDQGDGTVIAQWRFNTGSTTDHFNIYWEYWNTTNGVWVLSNGSSSSVPTSSYETKDGVRWFQTTWSPSGAAETSTKLRIYVDPIPKSGSSWRHGGVYSTPITNPKWTNAHGEALEAPDFDVDWYGDLIRLNATSAPSLVESVAYYQSQDGGAFSALRTSAVNTPVSVTPADGHYYKFAARWKLDSKTLGTMSLPSDTYYGRPMAPTNLTAMVVSCDAESGSVRLGWKDSGTTGDRYLVEWSEDPSAWDNHAEVESSEEDGKPDASGNGWRTIGGLEPGKTYWFRVRRVESKATDSYRQSGYACVGTGTNVYQVSCVVGTVPAAPTLGQVPSAAVVDEPLTLSWTHNSEDGSAQTAYELQVNDGSWKTVSTGTTSQMLTITPATQGFVDGSTLQWRVRTRGGLDTGSASDWSPWSATGSVTVWAKPTATISVSSVIEQLPVSIGVSAGSTAAGNRPTRFWLSVIADEPYETVGPDGSSAWVAEGDAVWSGEAVPGDDGCTVAGWEVSLTVVDIRLVSGATYVVSGGCYTAQGLVSEATPATFVADIGQTAVSGCDADVTFDRDTMSATIRPRCTDGPDGTLLNGVTLSVWRLGDDNVLIGEWMANDGKAVCLDTHPNFGACTYRVVATDTVTGAQGYSDVTIDIKSPGIVIQWDEGWGEPTSDSDGVTFSGERLVLPYNVDVSEQWAKQSSLNQWAGRKDPVSRYGTQRGRTATWSCVVSRYEGLDQVNAVRALAAYMGDVYVREPYGSGYWAHVDVSSLGIIHGERAVQVSLNVTKVEV